MILAQEFPEIVQVPVMFLRWTGEDGSQTEEPGYNFDEYDPGEREREKECNQRTTRIKTRHAPGPRYNLGNFVWN